MATKAEVQAAIEQIGIATAKAAKVAAALEEGGGGEVIPPQTADVLITEKANQSLLITTRAGINKVDWTIVSNTPPGYPWYSNALRKDVDVPAGGLAILPGYMRDGDFVKVLWNNQTAFLDGPKNTKKNTVDPKPTGDKPSAKWKMGLNVERGNPGYLEYNGQNLTKPPYYSEYMPSIGCNWVRFFAWFGTENDMGYDMNVTPDVHRFDSIIEASRVAAKAGIGVSLGMTDVLEAWSIMERWDAVQEHVRNLARECNAKLDPNMVVLETANELGGGDNAFFNPIRLRLHEIIRAEAPAFTIAHGCAGWNNKNWGSDWALPQDRNVVLRYHRYERGNWQNIDPCITQSQKLGTHVYGGEIMPEFGNNDYNAWGQNWKDCLDAGGYACAGWAVTGGRDFRMNRPDKDARLFPELETWTKRIGG